MSARPNWTLRFTHPTIEQVAWAIGCPDHLAAVTTEDGSTQAWAWDLRSDERRRVSHGGVGAEEAHILPDGSGVVWWYDEVGNERGRWMLSPFEGGEARPLFRGFHDGWMMGLSSSREASPPVSRPTTTTGSSSRSGMSAPREIYRNPEPAGVGSEWPQGGGGLSPDGALVCIHHSEHGDIDRQALRVLDTRSGEGAGDQVDPELRMEAIAWSPAPGARRLLFTQERTGIERPAVWDLDTRERVDLAMRGRGRARSIPQGWTPDGGRLLVHNDPGEGVDRLLSVDPASGSSEEASGSRGRSTRRGSAPTASSGSGRIRASSLRRSGTPAARTVLALPIDPPPSGTRSRWLSWSNPTGDVINGFITTPAGSGALPDDRVDPRGPRMAPHRSLGSRAPGVRRRGVRGPPGQLPGFHRPGQGVPGGTEGEHRVPGDRGHRGGCRPRGR